MMNLNDTQQIKVLPSLLRSYDMDGRICRLYHCGNTFEVWVLRDGVLCGKLEFTQHVEPGKHCAIIFTPQDGLLYRVWRPTDIGDHSDFQAACILAMTAYGDIDRDTARYWEGLCSIDIVSPHVIVVELDGQEVIAFSTGDVAYRLIDKHPHRWVFKPVYEEMLGDMLCETTADLAEHLYDYLNELLPTGSVNYH